MKNICNIDEFFYGKNCLQQMNKFFKTEKEIIN